MHLNKIKVKNYRSLKDVELVLDKENGTPNLSLIIGKNNSGKTSLLKIMKKMIVEDRKLSWDDFNIQYRKEIHKILVSEEEGNGENIEGIILDLYMEYDDNDDLNNILPLILDLNMENNIVVLEFKCQPIIHKIEELRNLVNDTELKEYRKFSDFMQENLNKYFETNVYARGYDYESYELTDAIEKLDSSIVKKIINITGISAKRDTSNNEKDRTLSQIAAKYYENFSDEEDRIRSLREEVSKTDGVLNEEYNKLFKDVIDDFRNFGNFLNGEENVNIHSKMDVSKLLKGNTVFSYQYDDEDLPENYNGLGYMNLLGIIFEVKACFQKFKQDSNRSKINILYIEEPEAHTHPQLQYVFIKNIGKLIENEKDNLNVQTIITTHSSHIVSQCKFEDTNFFIKEKDNAQIKSYADLENLYKNEKEIFEFVKKYITLSRAEIFFADKLILIEGDTERILLPTMMERVDNKNNKKNKKDVPLKCLTIVRQSLAIVRCFFRMTKYTQKFKLDIIQEYLDTGCSQRWLENKYSLPKDTLEKWWTVYNLKGPEGLKLRHFKRKFTVDFKLRVINYYLNNDVSMSKVAASHNLLCSQISIWLKLFMEGGSEALKPKKKGRPSKMSKMTKKNARKILKKESDEIAALKSELRQVKMERDILKKSLTLFGPSKPRRKQ